jgi:cysteine desulfurase
LGRTAKAAAGDALQRIARALRFTAPDPAALATHFVATSSGTEADNLVLLQPELWSFIIMLPTEHHAITLPAQWMANHHGCELVHLTPDGVGRLKVDELHAALLARPRRMGIVTVAAVNNEIGTVQDLAAVGSILAAINRGRPPNQRVWLHSDAVQAPGHIILD